MILYYNGQIHTLTGEPTKYDWILVGAGRILQIGSKQDRVRAHSLSEQQVDLQGQIVIPAFCDSHTHFTLAALNASRISLHGCQSLEEVLDVLQAHREHLKPGEWLVGGGYDKNVWINQSPHRRLLDKLYPVNPVALESKDLHALWINTRAIDIAGIRNHLTGPYSKQIEVDATGEPSGVLYEEAIPLVKNNIAPEGPDTIRGTIGPFADRLLSMGVTSVHSMEDPANFALLQELRREERLPVRLTVYLPEREMDTLIRSGMQSGLGDAWLRFGGIKLFVDGSLGSQTAELKEPYENRPDYFGISVYEEDALRKQVVRASEYGLACTIHAIGDRAIEKTVIAIQAAKYWTDKHRLVHRIEHAQLVPPDLIAAIRNAGAVVSMQPEHITVDVRMAEKHWGRRCIHAYPMRPMLEKGIKLAFGSDAPVVEPDPIKGIYAAVRRKYQMKKEEAVWQPQLAVSVDQAVRAYTLGAAYASNEQHLKGTLSPGKLADFVILNQDIFATDGENILDTRVDMTVQNGRIVFRR